MTIDREQAAAALGEVAEAERRTWQSLLYGGAATILMLWGVLCVIGYVGEFLFPRQALWTWLVANIVGLAGTVALTPRSATTTGAALGRRLGWGIAVLVGFGLVWSLLIGGMSPRQLGAFWPTLFMCGYVLAGLWLGRFFILLGLGVTVLTLAGYFWLGSWFALWMAAIEGGALIGGGLWLRRFG